ncbi:response regulator [Paracraurococcus ruber]|uniref:Serine/threonine protein phosphatase n=1 Tax=Paracraurococcus ruber TaxID=77675 RepID=A0ABS1D527_9PROT|nr:serine/threonine protein phosphatase [Paracraurococcus ruber]TDG29688.1 response regulator [Paracraurococcus ruber]
MAEAGPAATPAAAVEVLVVDDSSFNRLLLKRRLAELGYETVTMVTNGREALAAMQARAFDVVLLDLEMPELDGIGVLEHMRASGKPEPPVIVISALSDLSGVVRCIELGAEDYLPKSFDPPLLRARLSAILEKKRLRDLAAERLAALEAELESARQAQLSLVPHDFAGIGCGRLSLHAVMVPARQVGGDLYDALRLDDRRLLFAIGDVSGKGAPAALTMARTLGLMRAAARRLAAAEPGLPDPGVILALTNDDLAMENDSQTFVTGILGFVDAATGEVRMASAGHDPVALLAPGAPPRLLQPGQRRPALGVMEGLVFPSDRLTLAPGEGLLLYTDGVTEAEDRAQRFYTRERLIAQLEGQGGAAPEAIIARVIADLDAFAQGAPQADDITALALRYAG